MTNLLEEQYTRHRNLILYGLIGGMGATIDFLLYLILIHFTNIPPSVASFLSVSVGIINNFILNSKYNFKTNDKILHRFTSFYVTGVFGAVLSSLLIFMLHDVAKIDPTIAKIFTIPPVVFVQFLINKHVSFANDPSRFFRQKTKVTTHDKTRGGE